MSVLAAPIALVTGSGTCWVPGSVLCPQAPAQVLWLCPAPCRHLTAGAGRVLWQGPPTPPAPMPATPNPETHARQEEPVGKPVPLFSPRHTLSVFSKVSTQVPVTLGTDRLNRESSY